MRHSTPHRRRNADGGAVRQMAMTTRRETAGGTDAAPCLLDRSLQSAADGGHCICRARGLAQILRGRANGDYRWTEVVGSMFMADVQFGRRSAACSAGTLASGRGESLERLGRPPVGDPFRSEMWAPDRDQASASGPGTRGARRRGRRGIRRPGSVSTRPLTTILPGRHFRSVAQPKPPRASVCSANRAVCARPSGPPRSRISSARPYGARSPRRSCGSPRQNGMPPRRRQEFAPWLVPGRHCARAGRGRCAPSAAVRKITLSRRRRRRRLTVPVRAPLESDRDLPEPGNLAQMS